MWRVPLPWVLGCDAGVPFSDFARQVAAGDFPFVVTTSSGDDAFDVVHTGLAEVYSGAVDHHRIDRRHAVTPTAARSRSRSRRRTTWRRSTST